MSNKAYETLIDIEDQTTIPNATPVSNTTQIEICIPNNNERVIAVPINTYNGSAEILANSLDNYKLYNYCLAIPFIGILTVILIYYT